MSRPAVVVCFFEDIAQEKFITTLVQRAAQQVRISIRIEVRNAIRGSHVWNELQDYLRDLRSRVEPLPDVLVVVIDGNCKKASQVRREIQSRVRQLVLPLPQECVVCAIPDPHIERWYLEDQQAFSQAIPNAQARKLRYKCERDRYKMALYEAILASGVEPLLGGAEYGNDIASRLDPQRLDRSFQKFWGELVRAFRALNVSGE
ncbi:MAG: hypothetical protein KatS3mg131_0189 [Candidatus Tectimicrobiota bacterium]|nr:MAG: hypothetical protein KatS3mg131_0189 [Candidatus Tectomicrobia bacterium]